MVYWSFSYAVKLQIFAFLCNGDPKGQIFREMLKHLSVAFFISSQASFPNGIE